MAGSLVEVGAFCSRGGHGHDPRAQIGLGNQARSGCVVGLVCAPGVERPHLPVALGVLEVLLGFRHAGDQVSVVVLGPLGLVLLRETRLEVLCRHLGFPPPYPGAGNPDTYAWPALLSRPNSTEVPDLLRFPCGPLEWVGAVHASNAI